MIYSFIRFLFFILFVPVLRVKVEGREYITGTAPCIIASNHLSYLDPPLIGVILKAKMFSLGKEELFKKSGILAFILRSINVIPVRRGKTDIRAIKTALKALKSKPLLIFPQGTRKHSYDVFNDGVGFLCKKSGVGVVACKIYGTDEILPAGKKLLRLKPGKIRLVFDKVDNIKESDSYRDISIKVIEKIKSL
ncbi:MAG: lysophospholipid acyltransferase family protein [Candidatus Omnitrophota bacterium]